MRIPNIVLTWIDNRLVHGQVAGSAAVDDADVAAFRRLQELGVELEIRRVPTEHAENIEKLFK